MIILFVIVVFISILTGMALSVKAFGTGGKRAKVFDDIYFSVEDCGDFGVVYTKSGDYSAILSITNPVRKYSADVDKYYNFTNVITSIMHTLGEGYAIHKQDIFVRNRFDMSKVADKSDAERNFLSNAYFRHFDGRPYTESKSYLIVTQKGKGSLFSFDAHEWGDFLLKVAKVHDRLKGEGFECGFLNAKECKEYADRFFAMDFRGNNYTMNDFEVGNEEIGMGDRHVKVYSLLDVDNVGLPGMIRPFKMVTVNNAEMSEDLLSELDSIDGADTVVYNQMVFIPNQKHEILKLEKSRNRHASFPNPNNKIAVDDINAVLDDIARNGRQLVYAHFNLVIAAPAAHDFHKITNQLENIFARNNMALSKRAYNQLELFVGSFPGNCFKISPVYDRFLTVSEPALCLMYKERQPVGDAKDLKCWYTDRQGVPMAIDLTGKEGKVRYTDNSNFFVLGPSGSGKSFFMNTVMRQYYEQNTDIVIVDTGDSYEGLCDYFGGTYITYSKEHPISMNPFKVSSEEYEQNFDEKKDFLKSLIFLIYKGKEEPDKLEDTLIDQTIVEFFEAYFHPFKGFTDEEREKEKQKLIMRDKQTGEYQKFVTNIENRLESKYGESFDITTEDLVNVQKRIDERGEELSERDKRLKPLLEAVINDEGSQEGEKENARRQLMKRFGDALAEVDGSKDITDVPSVLLPAIIEDKYLVNLESRLSKVERQRKRMKVTELSFNSYYEYAVERLPQIITADHVTFDVSRFAKILGQFYKGGPYEVTLNSDMDTSLFDEKFIVFEIDKIKDNPVIFPIVTLIIMDVFTQKMRLKKGRKCLVIEEAWKAIATPVMANYIKYLYKTARKHWAMVGVVTQEIQDITSSDIVKDAIINNSGVFMLLDQSKFKDKFDEIKATLALTDLDCKKIFTINRLDNHDGRSPFKEVFIKRGLFSEVYGVEEPLECYMNYTTEKVEKEALKLYKRQLHGTQQQAITAFVEDFRKSGMHKTIDFSQKIMSEGKMYRRSHGFHGTIS